LAFFYVYVDTPFGQYAVSDGYFFDYFTRNAPSRSVNQKYGLFAHYYDDLPEDYPFCCPRSASPPCAGHIEVEKTPVEFPDANSTTATGINNKGWIVGIFRDASNQVHGFVNDGQHFTQLDYPGAAQTRAHAINDANQVVGIYYDWVGLPHGFLYFRGNFMPVDFPGAVDTYPRSINNRGDIVGMYDVTQPVTHGFVLQNGQYRTLDSPFGLQADITGINDRRELVGIAWDDPFLGPYQAFSYNRNGFAQLPRFLDDSVREYPRTVNNLGQYGGSYFNDSSSIWHGSGGYVTIHGYPYIVYGNGVFGMNDKGQIVGSYFDPHLGRTVGYVATLPK
jgi:probable HAF family extracellular repeat protein